MDPSRFLDSTQIPCRRCGMVNEVESLETLFSADVWAPLTNDREWRTAQMKALVPIEDD